MQHLDEGTIHSWLDGALSADEAARVEAHVKECPQCAAAVAEARGFIAGASRILTALDNAPRGVIPVAAPKKRFDPIVWRVAATLLVVAGGTLVVFRSGGRETPIATANADTSQNTITGVSPMAPTGGETKMTAEPTPPVRKPANSTRGTTIGSLQPSAVLIEKSAVKGGAAGASPPTSQALPAPTPGVSYSGVARAPASQTNIPARENQKVAAPAAGAVIGNIPTSSGSAGRTEPTPQTLSPMQLRGATALDVAGERFTLKEVGHPRKFGMKVTLYEVAPGDTVTFTEPVNLQLNAVVVTGVGAEERVARQSSEIAAATPVKRADAAATSAPDSQRPAAAVGAIAPAPSAPVPATRVEVANGVTTISWLDPTTGSVFTLSGRIPEARLQLIKIRIDRERAAAAAKKKP